LSICKLIVERMGGSVSVESEEGVGSKFNLIFNADTCDAAHSMKSLKANDSKEQLSLKFDKMPISCRVGRPIQLI
jgi:hypothetical protein